MVTSGKGSCSRTKSKKQGGGRRKHRCGSKGETSKSDQGIRIGSTGRISFESLSQSREQKPALAGCGDGSDDCIWKIGLRPGTGEPDS